MKRIILLILLMQFIYIHGFGLGLIRNINSPQKGNWDYKMEKKWQLNSAGDFVFASLSEIVITEEEEIFVMDSKLFKIHKFSNKGEYIISFGKKGEGPGELKEMDVFFEYGEHIIVPDRNKIHYFLKNGKFLKSIVLPKRIYIRAFISEDEFISAPLAPNINSKKPIYLSIYSLKNQTKKDIFQYNPFKNSINTIHNKTTRVSTSVIIHGLTPMMVIGQSNKKVYYGMNDSYTINCINEEGEKLFGFYVEGRKRKKVNQPFWDNLSNGLRDLPKETFDKIMKGLPQTATFFERIFIDKNGLIYIFISDMNNDSGQEIDIFSPAGEYLYSSEIKVEKGKSLGRIGLKDNSIVVEVGDRDEEISIAKYKISLPIE